MRLPSLCLFLVAAVGCVPRAAQRPEPASSSLRDTAAPAPAGAGFAPPAVPPIVEAAGLHDDAIVRLVARDVACTGTLIAEQLVLTAHHCVAQRGPDGSYLSEDVPASEIQVELGGDYLPWGQVGVRHVVAPPCGYGAGVGDIAIVVLDRPLSDMPRRGLELDAPPRVGAEIQPVGFGRCATSADGIRRRARSAGALSVLRPTRFQLDAAVCPGDSGGPAIDAESGKVVGVLSASVMDGTGTQRAPTEFTRLDKWRPVFAAAKLVAKGTNPAELPPLDCGEP